MPDLQAPRGMNDVLPEDDPLWRYVLETAARVARSFGYQHIETPIVEDAAVFLRTAGDESDIVSKEMYVFEDRGGGRLALRPEGTAGVCRAYLEHGMASRPQPVRLFYSGPFFRYDRPQAGRYRQLHQFGIECIGDASPAADVEAIDLQRSIYEALGLDGLVLRMNSIGTPDTRRRYEEVLREHFRPHLGELSADSRRRFETNVLRILDSKEDAGHPAVASAPSILEHLSEDDATHFADVRALLDGLGIAYEIDSRIVRGLDYYTHTVWEFEPEGGGGQATIGAGGRYDGLIEALGGRPTPGVGFATGIERIVLNLRERGIEAPLETKVDLYLAVPTTQTLPEALRIASKLRREGKRVVVGRPNRRVPHQLRNAVQMGAANAEVLGPQELLSGRVVLRDLTQSEDYPYTLPLNSGAHLVVLVANLLEQSIRRWVQKHRAGNEPVDLNTRYLLDTMPEQLLAPVEKRLADEIFAFRNAVVHGALPPSDNAETRAIVDLAKYLSGKIDAASR